MSSPLPCVMTLQPQPLGQCASNTHKSLQTEPKVTSTAIRERQAAPSGRSEASAPTRRVGMAGATAGAWAKAVLKRVPSAMSPSANVPKWSPRRPCMCGGVARPLGRMSTPAALYVAEVCATLAIRRGDVQNSNLLARPCRGRGSQTRTPRPRRRTWRCARHFVLDTQIDVVMRADRVEAEAPGRHGVTDPRQAHRSHGGRARGPAHTLPSRHRTSTQRSPTSCARPTPPGTLASRRRVPDARSGA